MDEDLKKEHQRAYAYHFFFNHGLFEEIMSFEDFISSIDGFIKEKLVSIRARDSNEDDAYNPRFDTEHQFEVVFPYILWRTTFLHSYFVLESALDQVCKNVGEAEDYVLTLKDISGQGIQRASTYLRKVCKVTMPFETDKWKKLQDFNKVRNAFVHSDGVVDKSNKDIIRIAAEYDGITLSEFDDFGVAFLTISKDFTLYSLKTIEQFFQDIHRNIKLEAE